MSANRGDEWMLTDRQLFLLQVIIDDYISNAQPVGSRSIAKRENVKLSPATIRNEMSDLEELGFLEKTHSSSGRVPSEKGYRFYVDHLLSPSTLDKREVKNIKSVFAEQIYEFEQVIQQSAQILSSMTSYTSILLGPEVFETKLKHMQIIPISDATAVTIFVTDTGHVEKKTVSIPKGIKLHEIEKVVNILNEKLRGVPIVNLNNLIFKEVAEVLKVHLQNYEEIMQLLTGSFEGKKQDKIYYGGKTNILSQPEFNDIEQVRTLLNTIEQQDIVYEWLKPNVAGINVNIGQENQLKEMHNCSVITASYSLAEQHMGTIAIIGPTRMEYSRVISLLELFSNDLTKLLTKTYHSK
jgi:heat-inducible transcriptional repressor